MMFWFLLVIVSVAGKSTFRFPDEGFGPAIPEKHSDSYRVSYNIANTRSARVLFPESNDNVIQPYGSGSDGKSAPYSSKTQFPGEYEGPQVKNTYGPPQHNHHDSHLHHQSPPSIQAPAGQSSYSQPHPEPGRVGGSHQDSYLPPKTGPVQHDSYSKPHSEPEFINGGFKPLLTNPVESALHEVEAPVLYQEGEEIPADPEQILQVANFYGSLHEDHEDADIVSNPELTPPVIPQPSVPQTEFRNVQTPTTEILRRDFLNGTAQTTAEFSHGTEDLFPQIPVLDGQFPPPVISNHYIPPNQPKPMEIPRQKGQNNQYFDPAISLQNHLPKSEHFHEGFSGQDVGILPLSSYTKGFEGKSNQIHHPLVPPVVVHVTVVNQGPEPKVQVVNNNPERLHLIQEVKVVNVSNLATNPRAQNDHMYDAKPVSKDFIIKPEEVELVSDENDNKLETVQPSTTSPLPQPLTTAILKQSVVIETPKPVHEGYDGMKITTFRPSGEHLMRPIELEGEPRTSSVTFQLPFKEERVGNATLKIAASSCPKLFGNLSLECDITPLGVNRDDLIFSWRRQSSGDGHHKAEEQVISNGGTLLIADERYQIAPTPFGSRLTIQNITVQDCGSYVCDAFHARGTGERALIDFLVYLCL